MQNETGSRTQMPGVVDLQSQVDGIRRNLRPSLFFWSNGRSTMSPTTREAAGRFVFQEWVGMAILLAIVFVGSSIYLVVYGISISSIFLIIGPVISFVAIFLFGGNIVAVYDRVSPPAAKKELLVLFVLMMTPYFFGTVLLLWFGLFQLVFSFSIAQLFQSAVLAFLGLQIIWKSRLLQEFYFEVVSTEVDVRAGNHFQ